MPISTVPQTPAVSLETVVRPFLPRTNAKPDRERLFWAGGNRTNGAATTTEGEEIPLLEWESSCRPEVTTLEGLSVYRDEGSDRDVEQNEIARKSRIERVENPDDPSQYVDVEVYDEITFENDSKKKRVFKLKNP